MRDKDILQREAKPGAGGLSVLGYGIVLAITLSILAFHAWARFRLAEDGAPASDGERFRRRPAADRPVPATPR